MSDSDKALFARLAQAGLKQPGGLWSNVVNHTVIVAFIAAIAFGLYGLTLWYAWLYWPVAVVLSLMLLTILVMLRFMRADNINRQDTAQTTIRGASQGSVELVGRIKGIESLTLFSETFQVPCVYQSGIASSRRDGDVFVQFTDQCACLIDDDTGEVFVPDFAIAGIEGMVHGKKTIAALNDQYRARQTGKGRFVDHPYSVMESLVPVGLPVRANGVFMTIAAKDSYLASQARYIGQPVPSAQALAREPVEQQWRQYADAARARAPNQAGDLRLNVLALPAQARTILVTGLDADGRAVRLLSGRGKYLWWVPVALALAFLFQWLSPIEVWGQLQGFLGSVTAFYLLWGL